MVVISAHEPKEKEVVYGLPFMPACLPLEGGGLARLENQEEQDGAPRSRGLAGFGNFFNTYAWSMAADEDGLFVGTFDWSFIMHFMIEQFEAEYGPLPDFELPCFYAGADLVSDQDGRCGRYSGGSGRPRQLVQLRSPLYGHGRG